MSCVYPPIITLTKLSICISLLRVFGAVPMDRYSMIACIVFLLVSYFPAQALAVFPCKPVSALWTFTVDQDLQCMDSRFYVFITATSSIVADLWIIIFVWLRVVTLQLPSHQRSALLGVFSTGLLVAMATLIRVIYTSGSNGKTNDEISSTAFSFQVWTVIELNLGIFCASAPSTLPLWRKFGQSSSHKRRSSEISFESMSEYEMEKDEKLKKPERSYTPPQRARLDPRKWFVGTPERPNSGMESPGDDRVNDWVKRASVFGNFSIVKTVSVLVTRRSAPPGRLGV